MRFLKFLIQHYDVFVIGVLSFYIIGLIDGRGLVGSISYAVIFGPLWALIGLIFFYVTKKPLKKIF